LYWYLLFLEFLVAAFLVIMARHTFLRGRYFLHIFQQKGYKLNEYWHWLIGHWRRRVITIKHILYLVLIVAMFWLLSGTLTGSAATIILTFFSFFWFGSFNYYAGIRPKKPLKFTPRMIRLSVPFAILCLIIPVLGTWWAFGYNTDYYIDLSLFASVDIYILCFVWVIGHAAVPFFIFPAAWITAPVEQRVHQHFINKAQKKLVQMPDLVVIAITGSYGKTSTKFMIRDLLKERMSVCATPGSYNTPMGICKVINNDLKAHHQVLVLEMGARYEGNIDELCDIAEPDIAVVTNVGLAHLETFGSQEAIAHTKSTLVRRLTERGTAVLNGDDVRVVKMGELRDDITVIEAGLKHGSIIGNDIHYNQRGMQFKVSRNGESETFNTKLLGAHNVQNMLLAIAVASCFEVRLKTMAVAARDIEAIEHRLELKKEGQITIIDDAFNSNPTGAKNAVEILSQFNTGRRIIITPGMIELGELQNEKNREFGRQIGQANLDLVILVGERQTEAIREGIQQTDLPDERVRIVESLFKANELMQDFIRPGDVILYENDLPDSYNEQ
jgi:UDP-N-acetylmuramoyl-tripeptide--D-alanyl-D-alanine ligase